MTTAKQLIEALQLLEPEAKVWPYEGECYGVGWKAEGESGFIDMEDYE